MMIKKVFVAAVIVAAIAAPAGARPVTVDDLMALRSVSDIRISPDGERVAYVVSSASFTSDAYEPILYVVGAAGGAPIRMTYGTRILNQPSPYPALRWSPDGRALSFLAIVDDVPQVVAMPLTGGDAHPITSAKGGVGGAYEWSPDGTKLAYVATDPMSEEEARRRREKSFVIDVDAPSRPVRIWVQDVAGGAPRALTPPDQYVSGLSWSPDGASIAYSAAPVTGFTSIYRTKLYAIAAAGGTPRTLVDRPGMNMLPQYSPDGQWIAFVSTDGRNEMMSVRGLHIVPSTGGAVVNLCRETGSWIDQYLWEPDGRSLLYTPNESTAMHREHMFEQPILRVAVPTGQTTTAIGGVAVHYSPSLSRDGRRLAYRSVGPTDMGEVFVMSLGDGKATKLTDVNPELRTLDLGEIRAIHWASFDKMEIWGLLLTPSGYKAGTRVPLIVYPHGGPIGGVTYGTFPQFMHTVPQVDPYPVQALASAGIAVLLPMPRGGSGYGESGFRMITRSWGEGDYRDIMAGVDAVIARGIADPDRLGVMGASYGGFMTNWIVTQTSRFKAASAMCSISDLADLYYLSEGGEFIGEYFGLPWEVAPLFDAHSPLTFASKVTTPLLIQHGEVDPRVPIAGARKFYQALKGLGKTVRMEIYPRGGHVIREPALQREMMRRNLEWFLKWLQPDRRAPSAARAAGGHS